MEELILKKSSCWRRPGLLVGAVPAFSLVHRHPGLDVVKLSSCKLE